MRQHSLTLRSDIDKALRGERRTYEVSLRGDDPNAGRIGGAFITLMVTAYGAGIEVRNVDGPVETFSREADMLRGTVAACRRMLAMVLQGTLRNEEPDINPYMRTYMKAGMKFLEGLRGDRPADESTALTSWMDAPERELAHTGSVHHQPGNQLDVTVKARTLDGWTLISRVDGPCYALTLAYMSKGGFVEYVRYDGTTLARFPAED